DTTVLATRMHDRSRSTNLPTFRTLFRARSLNAFLVARSCAGFLWYRTCFKRCDAWEQKTGRGCRFSPVRGVQFDSSKSWRSKEGSDMLVLSRKLGEKIYINDNICITVVDIDRGKIRLGIEAPRNVPIFRKELLTNAEPKAVQADTPIVAAK